MTLIVLKRGVVVLAVLLVAALPAQAEQQQAFPRLRLGLGNEPTSGGGVVAGDRYVTKSAVIAWNRKWNNLTLYLVWRKKITCATLRRTITKPGHLVQVHVTDEPRVNVGRPVANPQVAFLTIFRNPKVPTKIAGLKHGAWLKFTRMDSFPGGVWHGIFKVPQRYYGDGKLYGYNGTFAAKWCQLRQ
jgi:hypothetical protein